MPPEPSDPRASDDASHAEAIDKAAALDDYVGGFADEVPAEALGDLRNEGAFSGVLDLMLLLRQAAAGGAPLDAAPAIPASIGRHRILELAGRGGFSVVWKGFDPLLRRRVAVKVCGPDAVLSPSACRRFRREAELASRLVHPHIVTIHEVGEDRGQPYIVTEYCEGGSLADWLAWHPGPVAAGVAARITLALARAASHAHDAGIIHRDIKPANVMLVPVAAGDLAAMLVPPNPDSATPGMTIKLGDFGLGRQESSADGEDPLTQLTVSGTRLGTPAWMAPEQIDHSFGDVGPATDVHGIGLLLHRMLTGRPLRGGKTEVETYRQVLLDEPPPANRVVRGVPADLAAVCGHCLAKRPEQRYATAAALVDDLDRWLAGVPTQVRPVSTVARLGRSIVRHPRVALLAVAAVMATVAAAWAVREQAAERARAVAREDTLAKQRAASELQQGFEAVRAGNIAGALEKLARTHALDPGLASSFAGRWLERRTHGERDVLLTTVPAPGKPADLHCIAVSPSSDTAVGGGADGRLWLLRGLQTKPSLASVEAHDEINDVCFSPDGRLVASVGQDGRMRWWRIDESAHLIEPAGESPRLPTPLYAVCFTADGGRILYGGEDRVLRSVSLVGDEPPHEIHTFPPVRDVRPEIEAITPVTDSSAAVACGATIAIIDTTTGRVIRECDHANLDFQPPVIHGLAASPDGTRLVAAGSDRIPRIWDIASGKIVVMFPPHPNWVYACRFSPDGRSVVTACRDGVGRVHDATTGELKAKLIGHAGRIWDVAFDGQGAPLTAGADGTVRRWNRIGSPATAGLRDVPVSGYAITVIDEVTGGGPPRLLLMSDGGPGVIVKLDGSPQVEPACLAVRDCSSFVQDPPRQRLAFGFLEQSDRTMPLVRLLRDGTELPLATPAAGSRAVGPCVAWTPDGRLVTCSWEGSVLVWTPALDAVVEVGRMTPPWIAVATAATMPPRFAVCGTGGQIFTLAPDGRLAGAPLTLPLPDPKVTEVRWSPDGRLVACGMHDGGVHLFDGISGALVGSLAPHERRIEALAFTPDGRILLTADFDHLRISDTATFQTFDDVAPGWRIASVFASADGQRVVIGGMGSLDRPPDERAKLAIFELDPK
ncbi:MAG: protein kinase [Planctomycetia bacterium]|nr:protein kinase [Planctomycetia bacterium]